MTLPSFDPRRWGRPAQIIAVLALLVIGYQVVMGGAATAWAKHLSSKALRGIASVISDIDKAEEKNEAYEKAIEALGRQAQELQGKIDEQDRAQAALRAELGRAHARSDAADKARAEAIAAGASRPKVETLEQARDTLNKVLGYKP